MKANNQFSIKVAHIMGKYNGGGVESIVLNYYKYINHNNFQFDFICDEDSTNIPYDEIKSYGGRVIFIPPYQHIFKYHKELKKVLKRGNYKIVHSHINTLSLFSLCAAKCAKVSIRIAHSHSTTDKKEKKKNMLKQCLRPFSKIFATNYMCCSEYAGRWLFGNTEYDKGNVYLLNNSIDLDKFKYDKQIRVKKRIELNINDDTLVIGHIGRFVEQKNHVFLVDVFNEVYKINKNSLLVLIGVGPKLKDIREKVNQLNLEHNVLFLGQRKDVNELYSVFDCFCLPSLYEGLPVVGVEAQSVGLPCLLSDHMTQETKVLNNVIFLSIDFEPKKWAEQVIRCAGAIEKNTYNQMSNKGFDIKIEAKKLELQYKKYLECK